MDFHPPIFEKNLYFSKKSSGNTVLSKFCLPGSSSFHAPNPSVAKALLTSICDLLEDAKMGSIVGIMVTMVFNNDLTGL